MTTSTHTMPQARTEPASASLDNKNKDTENFPVGSFLIRHDLRVHVHAFYNFARAADNISDDPLMEAAEKIRRLNRFAECLLHDHDSTVAEAAAMRESLRTTNITAQHCLDLLTAFKRDAVQLRYADWADLLDYCRYSASPVGRYVLALHGIGKEAWMANDALCSALQIINHVQDCADDYRELDRVYIPHDMLAAHGASTADLSHAASTPALRATLSAMLDRLAPMMMDARRLPSYVPDIRLKLETSVIAALADSLIDLLYRRDPLADNVKLGRAGKFASVLTGVLRAWA